jgi:hypothetical protein
VSPSGLAGHPIAPFLAFRTHRVRSLRAELRRPVLRASSRGNLGRPARSMPLPAPGREGSGKSSPAASTVGARGGPGRWRVRSTRKPSS